MTGVLWNFVRGLRNTPPPLCGWVGGSAAAAETMARSGFDAIVFDMQHGAIGWEEAVAGIATVALAGKPSLVRIPVAANALAPRLLDAGAAGIIAPMINSQDDARLLVESTKFPPLGQRSFGPQRALALSGMDRGDYLRRANELQLVFAMVETARSIRNLDDILGVNGIDGVFVGPGDLSVSLSGGEKLDPFSENVDSALDVVRDKASHHGKLAGAYTLNGTHASSVLAKSYNFCSVGNDGAFLNDAAREAIRQARSI